MPNVTFHCVAKNRCVYVCMFVVLKRGLINDLLSFCFKYNICTTVTYIPTGIWASSATQTLVTPQIKILSCSPLTQAQAAGNLHLVWMHFFYLFFLFFIFDVFALLLLLLLRLLAAATACHIIIWIFFAIFHSVIHCLWNSRVRQCLKTGRMVTFISTLYTCMYVLFYQHTFFVFWIMTSRRAVAIHAPGLSSRLFVRSDFAENFHDWLIDFLIWDWLPVKWHAFWHWWRLNVLKRKLLVNKLF